MADDAQSDTPADAGPEPSVEDRLAAYFKPPGKSEAAPEQAEAQAESEKATETEAQAEQEEPAEQAEEEGLTDLQLEDGTVIKVPEKAKDGYMRRQDYSRKTEELAQLRKAAEDRLQYAEAREHLLTAVSGELSEYNTLKQQRQQYDQLDWAALYNADAGNALRLKDQRDQLDKVIAEKERTLATKAQQVQAINQRHRDTQWQLAVEGAKKRIGSYTAEEDAAMARQAEAMGFKPEELQARFADPRILHLFYKAAKWDSMQDQKVKALTSASKAPPVLKPGAAKGQAALDAGRYKADRDTLKRSGSVDDAAKLLARFK